MKHNSIGIIGGDIRMVYTGKEFEKDGVAVTYSGFEKSGLVKCCDLEKTAQCDYIILPLPPTRDFKNIAYPLSDKVLPISEHIAQLLQGKPIFCGMPERLKSFKGTWDKLEYYDYGSVNEFALKNAIPTADATAEILNDNLGNDLSDIPILILGWGRVGKACAEKLNKCGMDIYVGARKEKDFEDIKEKGFKIENSENIENPKKYDIIVNTVPFLLLDEEVLKRLNSHVLIVDLASASGGVDFAFAEDLGIKAIHALGLPGKYYPKKAGRIIKETIAQMIKEDAL